MGDWMQQLLDYVGFLVLPAIGPHLPILLLAFVLLAVITAAAMVVLAAVAVGAASRPAVVLRSATVVARPSAVPIVRGPVRVRAPAGTVDPSRP